MLLAKRFGKNRVFDFDATAAEAPLSVRLDERVKD